jgi:CBS domain-containing protein
MARTCELLNSHEREQGGSSEGARSNAPEPIAVQRDQSIAGAARAMRDNAVGSVLVARGDTLCGLVADRDIVVRALAESALPDSPVGEVCSPDLVAVNSGDDADEAVQVMRENAARRLPVMDDAASWVWWRYF